MTQRSFDVVVVGAGPAGEVVAGRLAEHGLSVALVERQLVGGECSYWACMPSKALLRPGELLEEVRRVPGAREALDGGRVDARAVLDRRNEIVADLDDEHMLPWLDERGVELVRGEGRLDGERRVRVGDEVLLASRAVVLATGSSARIPPVEGLAQLTVWTNREGTTHDRVPDRLLVLGGGPVGCELAQAWSWLGAQVTLIEASERILAKEEPFASEEVAAGLRAAGVAVRQDTRAACARRDGEEVVLELESGEALRADEILVAAGRTPRSDGIGLDTIGLEPGGFVDVDDQLRVPGHPWLFALGDLNGRALLTHMGKYQARVIAQAILGGADRATSDTSGPPRVTFTDPQVAAVGPTERQAREAGIDVRAVSVPTSATAGASFVGRNAPGTSQLLVDRARGVLVGATFVGPEVAEFVQAATVAIVGEVPVQRLWDAVAPFPTRSEIWLKLLERHEQLEREEDAAAAPAPAQRAASSAS